eukprot:280710_1
MLRKRRCYESQESDDDAPKSKRHKSNVNENKNQEISFDIKKVYWKHCRKLYGLLSQVPQIKCSIIARAIAEFAAQKISGKCINCDWEIDEIDLTNKYVTSWDDLD